jgi:hypothetical protein
MVDSLPAAVTSGFVSAGTSTIAPHKVHSYLSLRHISKFRPLDMPLFAAIVRPTTQASGQRVCTASASARGDKRTLSIPDVPNDMHAADFASS